MTCIGEPVSWLRLETYAAGRDGNDAQVREHVAACIACKACLDEIRADIVALPPLAVPAPARSTRRWSWTALGPAFAAVAAVVLAVLVWRGREEPRVREEAVSIKGIGEVVLGTVRERGGAIRQDVRSFAPGDRWKLVITCPPAAGAAPLAVAVTVVEVGDATAAVDRPLVPSTIACGNRVVVPGAFSLTGPRANRVCATLRASGDPETACVTIAPE